MPNGEATAPVVVAGVLALYVVETLGVPISGYAIDENATMLTADHGRLLDDRISRHDLCPTILDLGG